MSFFMMFNGHFMYGVAMSLGNRHSGIVTILPLEKMPPYSVADP